MLFTISFPRSPAAQEPHQPGLGFRFNEVDDPHGIAKDTSQRKFFVHARYEGGVNIPIWSSEGIELAFPIVLQAHALVSA